MTVTPLASSASHASAPPVSVRASVFFVFVYGAASRATKTRLLSSLMSAECVFAGIKNLAALEGLLAPGNELVGGAGHCRDHDRHLIAGVDLALDVARNVADAVEIGDRSSAEFHHEASHGCRSRVDGRRCDR